MQVGVGRVEEKEMAWEGEERGDGGERETEEAGGRREKVLCARARGIGIGIEQDRARQ